MISKRLKMIGDMVNTKYVIDVGCDHELLGIYLASKGIYTIGTDINEHSILQANENIKKYKVNKYVKVKMADGIDGIDTNNKTVVISGLGTSTILKIIGELRINDLIISSHNELPRLRSSLVKKGYKIREEKVILDHNKYYCIIYFVPGINKYNDKEIKYGPFIIKNSNNKKYFKYLIDRNKEIIGRVPKKYFLKRYRLKDDNKYLSKLL